MKSQGTVWYNSVLRGDRGRIMIGSNVHIMDRVVIHSGILSVRDVIIGDDVVIEPGCTIGPCQIGDGAYIRSGSHLLEGCKIGKGAVVGPNTVVLEFQELEGNKYHSGSPAASESRPLELEETISYVKKRESLAELGKEHEYANTATIEQITEHKIVAKSFVERNLNETSNFVVRPNTYYRSPSTSTTTIDKAV